MPIHHCLLGTPNTSLEELKGVYSHPQALGQCRENIKKMHLTPHSFPDTAGAAAFIAEKQDKHQAALASTLAAETYDLKILMRNFEDEAGNTTRFVVFAPEQTLPDEKTPSQTSLLFEVKNVPSALYKAMGALASNGLNMVKLESYMLHHSFKATQFYVEVDTHLHHPAMQQGLEELGFYCENLRVLGCYAQNRPKF